MSQTSNEGCVCVRACVRAWQRVPGRSARCEPGRHLVRRLLDERLGLLLARRIGLLLGLLLGRRERRVELARLGRVVRRRLGDQVRLQRAGRRRVARLVVERDELEIPAAIPLGQLGCAPVLLALLQEGLAAEHHRRADQAQAHHVDQVRLHEGPVLPAQAERAAAEAGRTAGTDCGALHLGVRLRLGLVVGGEDVPGSRGHGVDHRIERRLGRLTSRRVGGVAERARR